MYHIFFQPFDTLNVLKKHSTRAFVLMLFVASLLTALSATLIVNMMSVQPNFMAHPVWSQIARLNLMHLFIIAAAVVFAGNFIRAFLLHLVMKFFTDKGAYVDALKIMAVAAFLPGVYILLIIILGAIPVVGLGLATIGTLFAVIVTLSITLRAISVAYKADLVTVCIGLGVLFIATMVALHVCMLSAFGTTRMSMHFKYAPGVQQVQPVQVPEVKY